MPIIFHDEHGVRWTVDAGAPPGSREPTTSTNTTVVFTSDAGERRTCEACLPQGATWEDVEERIWCTLLHHAEDGALRTPVEASDA